MSRCYHYSSSLADLRCILRERFNMDGEKAVGGCHDRPQLHACTCEGNYNHLHQSDAISWEDSSETRSHEGSDLRDPLRAVVRCWKCRSLVGIHSKLKSSDARFKKAFIEQVIYWDVYYSERVFHCNDTLTLLKSDLYIPRCSCIYNTPPEDIKTKVLQKSKENMGMQGERFDCIACKNRVSISHAYGEKQCGVQLPICNGCVDKQKDKIFRGLDELESVPNLYEQRESLDIFLLD